MKQGNFWSLQDTKYVYFNVGKSQVYDVKVLFFLVSDKKMSFNNTTWLLTSIQEK